MSHRAFLLAFSLVLTSLTFAQQSPPSLIKLQSDIKNPEGIAVNPFTHKAYVVGEVDDPDRQVVMVWDEAALKGTSAPKLIVIPDETEYITVDPYRNRIYLSTRYGVEEPPDSGGDTGGPDNDSPTPAQTTAVTLGTLTVIDGETDTLIASYQFPEGVEPEGVAVDFERNVVYVGAKAPNPEPENGVCPWGTWFIDEDGEDECWTAGSIYAFNAADITAGPLKIIPAGDDPEPVVFVDNKVYAANEDDGTITIARAVERDGSGGQLITDTPAYSPALPPYSLGVFFNMGPNTLACPDKRYEADKMTMGWDGLAWSVFITDDKSRVAKIQQAEVVGQTTIPIDPILGQCIVTPSSDENGLNTANNIAFMYTWPGSALYVVSEQNTVAILDPKTLALKATITIPSAVHLDAVAADSFAKRLWITDEDLMTVYVLQGACVDGTGPCEEQGGTNPPTMVSPAPGATLTSSTVTFYWAAASGATSYQIWAGTSAGAHDLGVVATTDLSATLTNLPIDGRTLYVKLCALIGDTWHYNDYTYTAATIPVATISSPVPGSTLAGGTVTFNWTSAAAATSYQVWVGSTPGAYDLGLASTTGVSATINNLPINGANVFVRLYTLTGGTWRFSDAQYTAATMPIAAITSPAPGSTLTGGTATFTWTAATGATSYQVWVGTTQGAYDLGVVSSPGLTATVTNMPVNGALVYVRMYTQLGGSWYFNDYTYTAGP